MGETLYPCTQPSPNSFYRVYLPSLDLQEPPYLPGPPRGVPGSGVDVEKKIRGEGRGSRNYDRTSGTRPHSGTWRGRTGEVGHSWDGTGERPYQSPYVIQEELRRWGQPVRVSGGSPVWSNSPHVDCSGSNRTWRDRGLVDGGLGGSGGSVGGWGRCRGRCCPSKTLGDPNPRPTSV